MIGEQDLESISDVFWDIHPVRTSQQPCAAFLRIVPEIQEMSINKLRKLHSSKYYPL